MNNLMIDDSIHTQLASLAEQFIPQRSGDALYLRPFMIGVDANLNLGASQVYEFIVIASPRLASPSPAAIAAGYHHVLWLDPEERKFVEELSGNSGITPAGYTRLELPCAKKVCLS
ncbi:MAG: hypothetical protein V7711_10130 [Pseudomonadales bacterium]